MIERKRLLALAFYNKEHFSGSDRERNLRFRVEKVTPKPPEDAPDTPVEEPYFLGTVWPEPYSFEATADEKKVTHKEVFSEEGLCALVDWMNTQNFERDDWKR